MPVIRVHQGPTLTQDRYEEAVKVINDGQFPLRTPADWPVEGLLVHGAGQGTGGFRVVEVGVTDMPEIYAAHTFVSA